MVALELYRAVSFWNDMGWGRYKLHFVKNKEHQEVDFIIADENRPLFLIETKLTETQPSPALIKFQAALEIPAIQLTNTASGYRLISRGAQKILIVPAWRWLATLP
jgi:predicted AAA+ superfamily ATPase